MCAACMSISLHIHLLQVCIYLFYQTIRLPVYIHLEHQYHHHFFPIVVLAEVTMTTDTGTPYHP